MDHVAEILLNEKSCDAIIVVRQADEPFLAEIIDGIGSTRTHTKTILERFEAHDLVETEKRGRKRFYQVTEKGAEIADALIELYEQIEYEKPQKRNSLQKVEL